MFSKEWIRKEITSVDCIASYESPADDKLLDPQKEKLEKEIEDSLIKKEGYAVKIFLDKIMKKKNNTFIVKRNISKIKDSIKEIKSMMKNCEKTNKTKTDIKKCKSTKKKRLKKAKKYLQKANDIRQGLKK